MDAIKLQINNTKVHMNLNLHSWFYTISEF